jgi:hypothetical protein
MAAQTDGSVGSGTHFVDGFTLASAFSNPRNLDLMQVVNERGQGGLEFDGCGRRPYEPGFSNDRRAFREISWG